MPLDVNGFDELMTDIAGMASKMDADGAGAPVAKRILEAAAVPIHEQMQANAAHDPQILSGDLHAALQIGKVKRSSKTVTTFNNGTTETSMPTCLSGADGEPATTLRIDSSRGTVFKNNAVSTVLSAVIYRGGERITDMNTLRSTFGSGAYLQWSWQRLDEERFGVISASDSRLINDGFSFVLSADDVDTKVTFMCELITN